MTDRRRASWSVQSPLLSATATNSQWCGYRGGIDENRNSSIEEMDCEENGMSPNSASFTRHRTPTGVKPLLRYSVGSPPSISHHPGQQSMAIGAYSHHAVQQSSPTGAYSHHPVQQSTPTSAYSHQFGRKPSPSSLFSQLHLSEAASSMTPPAFVTITSTMPSLPSEGSRYPTFHRVTTTPMNTSRLSPHGASVLRDTPVDGQSQSSIVKRAGEDSAMEVSGCLATDDDINVTEADSSVCCGRHVSAHVNANKNSSESSRRKITDRSKWFVSRRACLLVMMSITILIATLMVNEGHYISMMSSSRRCVSTIDVDDLERSLVDRVYGQHLAVQIVTSSFRKFLSPSSADHLLVLSFHGWTGIGKNHMSNVIADRFGPADVRRFIVPLHFAHSSFEDAANLRDWILSNVTSACGLQLFIIDEVDKAEERLITSLHDVISDVALILKNASVEKRKELSSTERIAKVIVLLLSNTGSAAINAYVMSSLTSGRGRESISYTDVVDAMNRAVVVRPWYENMTAERLVEHLVPFLPLQRCHVRQCVEAVFRSRGVEAVTERMIDAVLDQLQYFPPDTNLFSSAGCRKVPSQVDLLLG